MKPLGQKWFGYLVAIFLWAGLLVGSAQEPNDPLSLPAIADAPKLPATEATLVPAIPRVTVIPVKGEIADPVLYLIRRGLKDAIDAGSTLVVLDMDTPGGSLGTTLEIMEALDRFPGEVVTYVNPEAGSAGAIIAGVTDEIYFAPKAVMGAAEVINGSGKDIGDSLKRKINSYMDAKIRAYNSSNPRRGLVLKAMMQPDFVLELDGKTIKPAGELLTLTAGEAVDLYGEPPTALLAAGITDSVADLLRSKMSGGAYELTEIEATWSENFASLLNSISVVLLALGALGVFIEFKTPGFGVFGIVGGLLLVLVFFGQYAAGLSGHEPILVFALGVALLAVEIFFLPGTIIMALLGVIMIFGSLIWAMADLWPNEPITLSGDTFVGPLANLGAGLGLALVMFAAVLRFMPRGWFWDRMVLSTAVGHRAGTPELAEPVTSLIGQEGVAKTDLFPSGQVEVAGLRYEATTSVGSVTRGSRIRVVGKQSFSLLVEEVAS